MQTLKGYAVSAILHLKKWGLQNRPEVRPEAIEAIDTVHFLEMRLWNNVQKNNEMPQYL